MEQGARADMRNPLRVANAREVPSLRVHETATPHSNGYRVRRLRDKKGTGDSEEKILSGSGGKRATTPRRSRAVRGSRNRRMIVNYHSIKRPKQESREFDKSPRYYNRETIIGRRTDSTKNSFSNSHLLLNKPRGGKTCGGSSGDSSSRSAHREHTKTTRGERAYHPFSSTPLLYEKLNRRDFGEGGGPVRDRGGQKKG